MSKIEKAIIKNEIDAEELMDYFRFRAEAKGEEFDLTIEDIEEYIENIKSKYMKIIKLKQNDDEKSTQSTERLTPDQIRNRKILLANQRKNRNV
ncbi:hypothetical protein [Tepidibacter formicigenes]|jgi:hypothetical protein|uniref:Uncharacterized protein n=1 Tax=Tepidibacter formicigenes DSM 15518 TaxID=1123349 RepID=A0A1M6Q5F4_9FIRM|nr:hypothetical protein [Tepidibacter formicigenes]SHK15452.1 hypothetical protein SAMN02744037_01745 [Tepidibacter formicigenes DSM 15518]